MLSQKAKYGLKAMVNLAKNSNGKPLLISDLAKEEHIPKKFLEVILLELKKHHFLQSKKGRGGGYYLLKKPEQIFVGDIIRVLDGPLAPLKCVSKTKFVPCEDCSDIENCYVRWIMKHVRNVIADVLDKRTLEDLINKVTF
jgi:Rrf2 family protein